jgi:hypothetical protein
VRQATPASIANACAFNYEAHATEFSKLDASVLKARMNADLQWGISRTPVWAISL